jgi:hypothetical protein
MWHGSCRLEASPLDFQTEDGKEEVQGGRRLEVAVSVAIHRDAPLYRVRVLLSLQSASSALPPPPRPTSSSSASADGGPDQTSNATIGGFSAKLSRSGISASTPLPYFLPCRFVRIALPVTFTQLAWDLHELGEQADGAMVGGSSSSMSSRIKRTGGSSSGGGGVDGANFAILRELGQSIDFVSRASGEHADMERGRLDRLKESLKDRLKRRRGRDERLEGEGMGVPSGASLITPFDLSEFA